MTRSVKRLKAACYFSNISMSIVGNLPPLLFLTFREQYGISYSLLGLLVLINFVTQLVVDLVFSFFSHKYNISATVKVMPLLTVAGLLLYAFSPMILPNFVYGGLILGTVIFSAAAGLGEVLISPVIAALPSPDPDREMSKLHSVYAWGAVGVVILSGAFLFFLDKAYWPILCASYAIIPLLSAILYLFSDIPELNTERVEGGILRCFKDRRLWACVAAIFLGGAAECTMAQWSSAYLEMGLGLDKAIGDIFGVALFSVMLGMGRTLYAKRGRNIRKVILFGGIGAVVCYFTAAVTKTAVLGLIACAVCGICVSMLWPGNLVVATERFPKGGVFIFAIMAAGGDLGASVGPQLVGIVTDKMIASVRASEIASSFGISTDQLGMKAGMLVGMLFPLAAVFLYLAILKKDTGKRNL